MEFRKVLVIRLSAVGDVIRTLPAVRALKNNCPSAHVTWVVEEPSKSFLDAQPEVDEVILFPRSRWRKGIASPGQWRETFKEVKDFIATLRGMHFDLALDFHGILKSGLISFVSGSSRRVGFDRRSSKEGNFFFSNVRVSLPTESISRYEKNFTLLRGIGLESRDVKLGLHVPPRDQEYVECFFRQNLKSFSRPLIAIHPGTNPKNAAKRWMPDRYAGLADRLIRETRATVIFTWGPDERGWVERIRERMGEASWIAPRTESLTQLGEIFRRCDLYIGGDTGPTHVAALVGTPVVAIFGPTHPVQNEPFGLHRMVRKGVTCSPCRKRSCEELLCLQAVTVDDVLRAAREFLAVPSPEAAREMGAEAS